MTGRVLHLRMRLLFGAPALAACSQVPMPIEHLARSRAAVASAEMEMEMGSAAADERAARHLRLAREQLGQAVRRMDKGESRAARLLLIRAEADAGAALELARARAAQLDARAAIESVRRAMAELEGGGT